jgi:hypothetical protein
MVSISAYREEQMEQCTMFLEIGRANPARTTAAKGEEA